MLLIFSTSKASLIIDVNRQTTFMEYQALFAHKKHQSHRVFLTLKDSPGWLLGGQEYSNYFDRLTSMATMWRGQFFLRKPTEVIDNNLAQIVFERVPF